MAQPSKLIFWGAGATAALGIRTTARQGKFIRLLADEDKDDNRLIDRVARALGSDVPERWRSPLYDIITILGDANANYVDIDYINDDPREAMRRNWSVDQNEEEELKNGLLNSDCFMTGQR
jgi:hypothetical protein